MGSRGLQRERRLLLIAGTAALALALCLAPRGIRATGIYSYACLMCGSAGGVASDRTARWLIYVAHAPDWLIYLASYAVFFIANAFFFFAVLWFVSATARVVARVVTRPRPPLG